MAISDDLIDSNAKAWRAEGRQAWMEGDFTRSQRLFEKELAACRSLDRKDEMVYALFHITQAMRYTPDYDPSLARPLLEEALHLAQEIGTDRYIKPAEENLAWLDLDSGNNPSAFTKMQKILPWFFQVGDQGGTCHGLELIAEALIGLGVIEPALRLYAAATANREQYGMQHTVAAVLSQEEAILGPARSQLGAEQSAVVEAAGRMLTLDQAVAYALSISLPVK